MQVSDVETADVLVARMPIRISKPETTSRLSHLLAVVRMRTWIAG